MNCLSFMSRDWPTLVGRKTWTQQESIMQVWCSEHLVHGQKVLWGNWILRRAFGNMVLGTGWHACINSRPTSPGIPFHV